MENVLCGSVSVQCQGRGNDDITDNAVDGGIIGGIAAAAVRVFLPDVQRAVNLSQMPFPFKKRIQLLFVKVQSLLSLYFCQHENCSRALSNVRSLDGGESLPCPLPFPYLSRKESLII